MLKQFLKQFKVDIKEFLKCMCINTMFKFLHSFFVNDRLLFWYKLPISKFKDRL